MVSFPGCAHRKPARWLVGLFFAAWMLTACVAPSSPVSSHPTTAPTDPLPEAAPPLPMVAEYDPTLCGIPTPVDITTTVTGEWQGQLIRPVIYLYDSHLRQAITGQLYPGTRVHVELSQTNPALNYYFVKTIDLDPPQSGWIPAPFLKLPGKDQG